MVRAPLAVLLALAGLGHALARVREVRARVDAAARVDALQQERVVRKLWKT